MLYVRSRGITFVPEANNQQARQYTMNKCRKLSIIVRLMMKYLKLFSKAFLYTS